jgi:nucleoside-diphosphate-sugar epimerase
MKKKVLITGINGFVGRNLATDLMRDFEVYGICRKRLNFKNKYKLFIGDLKDANFIKQIDKSFYTIINCAANTNHFEDEKLSYEDNCLSLKNLLTAKNIFYEKIIHISTEAIFLGNDIINVDENSIIPKEKVSTYSMMKREAEEVFQKFSHKRSTNMILRPRLIWDNFDSPAYKKLKQAIDTKKFAWVNNGNYLTKATHINNLILSIRCALKFGKKNKKYFITDGKEISFKNLVQSIISKKIKALSIPRIIIYFLCIAGDFLTKLKIVKSKNPTFCKSTYFLTFSEVKIDDNFSSNALRYYPKNYYIKFDD